MKLLVCGPRDWIEQKPIEDVLRHFPEGTIVVHGKARGVDIIAGFVAEFLGMPVRAYPVDNSKDGPWPRAGVLRNHRMLSSEHPSPDGTRVDLGIAFKRQPTLTAGTGDMVRRLRRAGVPVLEILWKPSTWDKYLESLELGQWVQK